MSGQMSWSTNDTHATSFFTQTQDLIIDSKTQEHPLRDSLLILLYLCGISFLVLVTHLIIRIPTKRLIRRLRYPEASNPESGTTTDAPLTTIFENTQQHVVAHEDLRIFAFNVARLGICLILLSLSIYGAVRAPGPDQRHMSAVIFEVDSEVFNKTHHSRKEQWFTHLEWLEIVQTMFYLYTSSMAVLTLISRPKPTDILSTHLALLLFAAFGVFFYRDIIPLGTFTMKPMETGWLDWVRLGLLFVVGVLLPLTAPRRFEPLDRSKNLPPTAEQTASWLSFASWSFLDSTIKNAYSVPHLPYDDLPALADTDHVDNLVKVSFPHLDPGQNPAKSHHIFLGLMKTYPQEYFKLAFLLLLRTLANSFSPVTINQLLAYLEDGSQNTVIRPWVWIVALVIAPVASSMAMQGYIFVSRRLLVRTEGIITQLVFEHSLKIRLKEDTPSEGTIESGTTTVTTTPPYGSVSPVSHSTDSHPVDTEEELHESSDAAATSTQEFQDPGKAKATASKAQSNNVPASANTDSKSGENLVGKITNLVSTDLYNIVEGRDFLFLVVMVPTQLGICVFFLHKILGWAAFVGLGMMLLTFPIPGRVAALINGAQIQAMKKTDARVQAISEAISIIRMIKLFAWEGKIAAQVTAKREEELVYIKRRQLLGLVNMNLNYSLPVFTMISSFTAYTVIMKEELTASKIFSAIAIFDLVREVLHLTFYVVPRVISAKVSLDRLNTFLNETDLLDRYARPKLDDPVHVLPPTGDFDVIGFRNATFTWRTGELSGSGACTPRRNFQLRIEGDMFFEKGKLNLIVGPTGAGKTSLLMALLGEMHFKQEGIDSFFNLPRDQGVAYCAQEPWVQNATIKENILFGTTYDEARYKKVLFQCALEHDMTLFNAGDATEVGEKGLTLSGGQKARVSLARALYSSAQILILDDILSALDVHTSRTIVDACLSGDLINGRTVLLVTHNLALTSPIADYVVVMGSNGRIISRGTVLDVIMADPYLRAEVAEINREVKQAEKIIDPGEELPEGVDKPSGKLIVKEETVEGRVGWSAFSFFFGSFGGPAYWTIVVTTFAVSEICHTIQVWWLGYWARQYESHLPSEVNAAFYLSWYTGLLVMGVTLYNIGFITFLYGSIRGSRLIHARLVKSTLGTTLHWLDSTPTGRIVSRFTQDIRAVDGPVASMLCELMEVGVNMVGKVCGIVIFSPIFFFPSVLAAAFGRYIGNIYMAAQLSIKREMSNAKSPVYSYFGAAVAGLVSIRAFGAEDAFKIESRKRIDIYTRPARTFYNLNRWICLRIDVLGAFFGAGLASYLVYGRHSDASTTGFSLTLATSFTGMLLWVVRIGNEFEVEANSLERIKGYVEIEQEPKPVPSGNPPAYWPTSGSIRVEGLSARYTADGPNVLHDVTFEIKSGERVGVVGRTGAGKSSLSLALLRMIPTTGKVYYDDIETSKLNLDALRNNVTIIPQQPGLMSGTLRQNLDPFGEHDDAVLNSCLRTAGLFSLQEDDDEDKIGLDSSVASGGTNFSLGQRQIIALARAIVRRSKVYILDEATASVDYKTDSAIQEVIASEFNDITLIIIAHRLQTIMSSDKILVLDAGKVVEFDSPAALLKKDGMFKALVDGSSDRDVLYGLIKGYEVPGPSTVSKSIAS